MIMLYYFTLLNIKNTTMKYIVWICLYTSLNQILQNSFKKKIMNQVTTLKINLKTIFVKVKLMN